MKVNFLFLIFFSILIAGCASTVNIQLAWDSAIKNNTTYSYESFLKEYPDSKYSDLARQKLESLYELEAWNIASRTNSISSYEQFILLYPNSPLKEKTLDKIDELNLEKDWSYAKSIATKDSYNNFISKHPQSIYNSKAQVNIFSIEEDEEWEIAENINSVDSYEKYLIIYPNGEYYNIAKSRIDEIKIIVPEWNKTLKKNTIPAYQDFISKYPLSNYSQLAKDKIIEFEKADWNKAVKQNSIKSYQKFINDYPGSTYRSIAEGSIINLEVDKIFKGEHGILPQSTKISENYDRNYTVYNVHNDTEYSLTVRFSGNEIFKVTFLPGEKGSIELYNGNYRITASVNAYNVTDYAGAQDLDGGDFSSTFYISNIFDKSSDNIKYLDEIERYQTKRRIIR